MTTSEIDRQALEHDNRTHQAICDWIREDAPVTVKMSLMPEHVAALVARLAALRGAAPADGGSTGAEAMRERCAALCDEEARDQHNLAVAMIESDPRSSDTCYGAVEAAQTLAATIRALPTDTDPPGSPDADGTEGRR